jgi:hypothetical protein
MRVKQSKKMPATPQKLFSPKVKNFWRLGPERCTQNEYRITRELKKIRLA